MSKIEQDIVVNGLNDSEIINTKNPPLTRKGVKSFKINSSEPSFEIRRPVTTKVMSHEKHQHAERTSSISYKPPSHKKKETPSSDSSQSPNTIYSAIDYITSPARYIGSFFTGKKEPMVVKSAPTLNKEKVKTINTKRLKEPLSEIIPDAEKDPGTNAIPSPTMLSVSNTTVSNSGSLIKKSDSKTDGKKNTSASKRSVSQNSKYAHKMKSTPSTLKEKKLTSPVGPLAPPEVKVIPASDVHITAATLGAYRVVSKSKEEAPPKVKKDARKTSPERKSKTAPVALTASTPTQSSKKHLINTLIDKIDTSEEPSGPTVLTCLQPSLLHSEKNSPNLATSQLRRMVGGAGVRNYERSEKAIPKQLANKCTPDFSNIDFEPMPTVLTPTCLETDNYVDAQENVTLVSLSANNLVNSPQLSTIDSHEKASKPCADDDYPTKTFPSPMFPTILDSPPNYKINYVPNKMTSPQHKLKREIQPDASPKNKSEKLRKSLSPSYKPSSLSPSHKPIHLSPNYKPISLSPSYKPAGFSPSYKPVGFSPSRNTNGNFQPLSPGGSDKTSGADVQTGAVATSTQSNASHASYRVISPDRLPVDFQEYGKHKYRSTSRSPTRSTMPYPQGRSMNSYTERYNALKNKKKIPNRSKSPVLHGYRQQSVKGKSDTDNPVILVMPSKKFKELAQEHQVSEQSVERITVTPTGSYKVTTKPSDHTVAKKPSNATLTTGEASTSNQVIGPDNVHSNIPAAEAQELISHNSSPLKEQSLEVDTKPPCKGIMLKSTDKVTQGPLLSSKVSDKNFVQETVRRLKMSYKNKEIDYFNSLDHYGGTPAQHAAASTMLGEFP